MPREPEVEVHVHNQEALARLALELLGHPVDPLEWGEAVGAPPGALVHVTVGPSSRPPRHIVIRVQHAFIVADMERRLYRAEDGALVVRNVHFHAQPFAPEGFGSGVFVRQVRALQRLGVARIEAEIAGGPGSPYNGYYTWARMGFDAPLTAAEQRRLPPGLVGARTLHELLTRPGGLAYWRRHGSGRAAVFDLSPDSPHRAILMAYIEERAGRHG